jgi:hypothetical protein
MILVRALNLKFLNDLAATAAGTPNSPHSSVSGQGMAETLDG